MTSGAANTTYGVLLVICIIFMPQGIVGALRNTRRGARHAKAVPK